MSPPDLIDTLGRCLLLSKYNCSCTLYVCKWQQSQHICHTHSLASLQWSGLSDQWTLLPTENGLQCLKWSPYKGRGAFSTLGCVKRREMAHPVPTNAFLQPVKTATMCTACHDYAHPPPPTFFASAKPIFKQIASTDNMRPKLHDKYTPHQWLWKELLETQRLH